jgi:tetratricopeptide (TPR) repeat protein
VSYLWQAGARALELFANRDAVQWFERALAALARVPQGRDSIERAIDLHFGLRHALWNVGEPDRVIDHLRMAEALADALQDTRRKGRVSSYLSHYFWGAGENDLALVEAERAREFGDRVEDDALRWEADLYRAVIFFTTGEYRRAVAIGRTILPSGADGDSVPRNLANLVRPLLARCLAELGEFEEAGAHTAEAVAAARRIGSWRGLVTSYGWGAGALHLRKGDFDRAIGPLEQALAVCRAREYEPWFVPVAAALGVVLSLGGRVDDGLPLAEEAVRHAEAMRLWANYPLYLTYLGEAYLLGGRVADARRYAEKALAFARDRKERGYQAWAIRLLGESALESQAPDDLDAAHDCFREALAVADELGMRPVAAHCHLGLGKVYRRTGQRERAQEQLVTSTTMYGGMDMRFWLEKAHLELRQLT